MLDEPIRVECYAGAMGEETPRAVVRGDCRREVTEVRGRWVEEARDPAAGRRRWYRLACRGGGELTIYRDLALDLWFLRHFEPAGREGARDLPAA